MGHTDNDAKALVEQSQLQRVLAIRAFDPDMTVVKACEEVGISRTTYYRYLQDHEEVIDAVKTMRRQLDTLALVQVEDAIASGLDALTKDLTKTLTPAAVKLQILAYLHKRRDELARTYQTVDRRDDQAKVFLEGIQMKKGQSKFSAVIEQGDLRVGVQIVSGDEDEEPDAEIIDLLPSESTDY